ncbi:hypothetical protein LDENG_00146350 [Lucifuga dentata]|nr:hypothetical protein LDENG_00146350 [Lucifuga dentata]
MSSRVGFPIANSRGRCSPLLHQRSSLPACLPNKKCWQNTPSSSWREKWRTSAKSTSETNTHVTKQVGKEGAGKTFRNGYEVLRVEVTVVS